MKRQTRVYTKEDIFEQLRKMGAPKNSVVLMHSSLRLIGQIEGGANGLLDSLIEYFTADGGLFCVPTHTWSNLNKEITLDMTDPSTCLGAFSDIAAADPRGIRSENPTHSMMVFGDRLRAEKFVRDEHLVSSGTAPNSCYGKICEQGGFILLAGVAHNKNTYLHCVNEMLGMPNRLGCEQKSVTVKRATGEIVSCKIYPHRTDFVKDISMRFPKYETAFRYHGAITDGFVGDAPTQLCDARIMKETIELILKNCEGVDPLADEKALPPKWYAER